MSSASQPAAVADARGGSRAGSPKVVMAIVCVGVLLVNLDLFIVNVAIPQLPRDRGPGALGALPWTLSGYAIVYASLLAPFAPLADRHSRRAGFLLGVAVFVAASA